MKKITLMTAVAMGFIGVTNAVIYDAATDNTTLAQNYAADLGALTLSGTPGALVVTNANGSFNNGGFSSTDDINTLNGTALADTNTVAMKLTVDSIAGNLRSSGVQFGMSRINAWPDATTNNLIFGAEASNNGSDVQIRFTTPAFENLGFDATHTSVTNGFSMEIIANAAGYTFTISDIIVANSSVAGIINGSTSATVTGTFSGSQFVDDFGTGHLFYTAQKWNQSPVVPLVSTISEASIDVYVQADPVLEFSPTALSLELYAPDTSTNGTITASYSEGVGSSSDIEIVSLMADAGFSASVVNPTLGLANTDEEITVTFTNSVGLADFGDATNSTLVITWTEVGSGVTNTSDAALAVTYIPESPEPPVAEHGTIVYEAEPDNSTLVVNTSNNSGLLSLTGTPGDLVLTNANGSFNMGGFASSSTIDTLNATALTDEDTVVMTMTVDSIDGSLRSNGIEFGLAEDAVFRGGSTNNLLLAIKGPNDGGDVEIFASFQDIGDSGYAVTAASLYDGFGLSLTANSAGYTFVLTDVELGTGTNWVTVSGTFAPGVFTNYFSGGNFYYAAQKFNTGAPLISTISDATLSVDTPVAEKPVITGSFVSAGNFYLEFTGTVGQEYGVESTDNLILSDSWGTVTNIPSLPESPMTVGWPATDSAAFYRVFTP